MCIDKKINPSSMRPYEQQALIVCASQFLEGKKKVQYLDDSVYKLFDEIINNGTKRILELSDDYKERQNMFEATEKEVKDLRKEYPKGTRVVLVQMDDTQAPPVGTKGTVLGVDDIGSLLMAWDNGCGLNVVYGEDEMKKINDSMNEYNI